MRKRYKVGEVLSAFVFLFFLFWFLGTEPTCRGWVYIEPAAKFDTPPYMAYGDHECNDPFYPVYETIPPQYEDLRKHM